MLSTLLCSAHMLLFNCYCSRACHFCTINLLFAMIHHKVMEVLMSLQGSQMEADDPTTSYMLQV